MENETQVQEAAPAAPVDKTKLSQKDAIFMVITDALAKAGIVKNADQKLKELVTKEVRKTVRQALFTAFRNGEIRLGKPYDDSKLKKYCSGLINNWLKKDPRFN